MTATPTLLGSANPASFGNTSATTGSLATTTGRLLVIIGAFSKNSLAGVDHSGDMVVSNSGTALTWTKITGAVIGETDDFGNNIGMWWAVSTGTTITFTLGTSGTSTNAIMLSVHQLPAGMATTSPVGVTGKATTAADGAVSLSLTGSPDSASCILGGVAQGIATTGTISASPGTNHTETLDLSYNDNFGLQNQYQTAASSSFAWADIYTGSGTSYLPCVCAAEFKAAGGAAPIETGGLVVSTAVRRAASW